MSYVKAACCMPSHRPAHEAGLGCIPQIASSMFFSRVHTSSQNIGQQRAAQQTGSPAFFVTKPQIAAPRLDFTCIAVMSFLQISSNYAKRGNLCTPRHCYPPLGCWLRCWKIPALPSLSTASRHFSFHVRTLVGEFPLNLLMKLGLRSAFGFKRHETRHTPFTVHKNSMSAKIFTSLLPVFFCLTYKLFPS
jgi:hypothetical protein